MVNKDEYNTLILLTTPRFFRYLYSAPF